VNERDPRMKRIRRRPSKRSLRILRRGLEDAGCGAERGTRTRGL
jgi:hypothetical protein